MRRYQIADDVLTSVVGDELLLLNADSEDYFSLNEVGAAMFERLVEGVTSDEIVEAVVAEYDAEPATVRADLDRTIAELLERGLITPQSS